MRKSTSWRSRTAILAASITLLVGAAPVAAAGPAGPVGTPPGTLIQSIYISEAALEGSGYLASSGIGVTPMAGCLFNCYHVRDVAFWYEGQVYETQVTMRNITAQTNTVTLTQDESVANSFNAGAGVSGDVVSAAVGFNVTSTVTLTYSATATVPAYSCRQIKAYELYKVFKFNVFLEPFIGSDKLVFSGWAQNRDGVRYDVLTC